MTEQPWAHHPGGATPPGQGTQPSPGAGPSGAPSPFPAPPPSPFPAAEPPVAPVAGDAGAQGPVGGPPPSAWGSTPSPGAWGSTPPPGAWGTTPPSGQGGAPPPSGQQPAWGDQPVWGEHPGWGGQAAGSPHGASHQGYGPGPHLWSARPKPGIIPLRPIRLGEIFDGAFQAIRSNPRTMIGFSAIVVAVTSLLSVVPQAALYTSLSGNDLFDPDATNVDPGDLVSLISGVTAAVLPSAIIKALALTMLNGLLIIAVSSAVLGRRMTPAELWRRARPRVPRLVGLAVLVNLVIGLPVVLALVPGAVLLATGNAMAGGLLLAGGFLLSLLVLAYLYTKLAFAAPALLLEDQHITGALRRSWTITHHNFWRTFLILGLLTNLIVGIGAAMLSTPFSMISSAVGLAQSTPYASFGLNLVQLGIVSVGEILAYSVFYPFQAAVTALLYIDLRMRSEGLDLELIRATEEGMPA